MPVAGYWMVHCSAAADVVPAENAKLRDADPALVIVLEERLSVCAAIGSAALARHKATAIADNCRIYTYLSGPERRAYSAAGLSADCFLELLGAGVWGEKNVRER